MAGVIPNRSLIAVAACAVILARPFFAPGADTPPADELRGILGIGVESRQIEGVPILLQLTVKNAGTRPLHFWSGGPDYPPGYWFELTIADRRGRQKPFRLYNGAYTQGSGGDREVAPGATLTIPAALAPLPAGTYTLQAVNGDAQGYYPGPGKPMTVTWPAVQATPNKPIEVRADAEGARAFGVRLLERVRGRDFFARQVAAHFRVQPVLGAMLADLIGDDEEAAIGAAETLFPVQEYPKEWGAVFKRAMLKQLKVESPSRDLVEHMASLAANEGGDEALDAVLAYVEAGRAWPNARYHLQHLSNFKQPRAAAALRRELANRDAGVRFTAAAMLSKRRDPAAVPVLVAASRQVGSDDRPHAFYRLADYPDDPRATAAIVAGLNDPADAVRRAADYARQAVERERARLDSIRRAATRPSTQTRP